jgi:hypothetical protein
MVNVSACSLGGDVLLQFACDSTLAWHCFAPANNKWKDQSTHTHKNLKDACFHSLRATRALEYTCFCVLTVHSGHKIVRVGGHTFLKSTCNSCLFGHCCSCCCLRLLLLPLLRLLPPLRIPMRLPRALQMLTLKWHQVVCYQTTI